MTCKHCVGAEDIFNEKEAKKQLKRYRKKGPRKTSQRLITSISENLNGEESLLDIGGGVGAVHLELMKKGIIKVTDVDASQSYIRLAEEESTQQGYSSQINYVHGDFVDQSSNLEEHDIVVLDKVVCCYPDMNELLNKATDKSRKTIGLVYPKSNWIGRMIIAIGNTYCKIKRNPFRVFMHSNRDVRNTLNKKGFTMTFGSTVYPWNIEVYTRNS